MKYPIKFLIRPCKDIKFRKKISLTLKKNDTIIIFDNISGKLYIIMNSYPFINHCNSASQGLRSARVFPVNHPETGAGRSAWDYALRACSLWGEGIASLRSAFPEGGALQNFLTLRVVVFYAKNPLQANLRGVPCKIHTAVRC